MRICWSSFFVLVLRRGVFFLFWIFVYFFLYLVSFNFVMENFSFCVVLVTFIDVGLYILRFILNCFVCYVVKFSVIV